MHPGVEVDVGHHRRRALAAGVDDLVQQVGGLRGFAAFDLVEGELINDQPVEAGVIADSLRQGVIGQAGGQIDQQIGAGGVADTITHDTSGLANRLDDSAFADPALADQDEVVLAANEGASGQFLDLRAVDRLGIEVPVEVGQRVQLVELGVADATGDGPFATLLSLLGDEQCANSRCDRPPRSARASRASS